MLCVLSFLHISFPEAAKKYILLQSAERMRCLRKGVLPETLQNIVVLHELLMNDENRNFAETLQNPPNR